MIDIQDSSSQPLDNIPDSTQRSDDSILSGKDQIGADLPVQDSTQASTNLKEEEALEDLKYYARSLPDVDDLAIQPKLYPPKRFDAKEKLAQVERGLYLTDYLDSISSQDFAHGADDVSKEEIERILKDNYRRNEDGTIEMVNKNQIERQRQVLGFLVKQLGSALFSGKSLSTISLPVTIFEPQSYLERQAYGLSYAPYFLERAGQTEDVLEQFKLTVAHYLASLQLGSNPQKPFNPHLGETFQGVIAGCPVYVEHISNTPPVSAIQMVGKNFNLDGVTEFTASIAMNSVKSWKVGYLRVNLLNNKTTIFAQYPPGYMQGTAMGRRLFQFADKFYIFDLDNRLYAEVDMDLNDGSWFRNKSKEPKDRFQGGIWKVNEAFIERLENALGKKLELGIMKFKEKDHAVCKLETIEGSWLENVKIGEKEYWSYGNPWPHKLHYFNNPLPSDSNFRTDVLYLRLGDETRSQEDKQELGEVLRQDQKLRDQYKSKNRK